MPLVGRNGPERARAPVADPPIEPVILVLPFSQSGEPGPGGFVFERLRRKLADAMSRFGATKVVVAGSPGRADAAAERWSDYRLSGDADFHADGTASLSFRLVDETDGTLVWSRVFARQRAGTDAAAAEDAVVRAMASAVAEPFGVLWSRERSAHALRDPRRAVVIELIEYWRRFDPARHEIVYRKLAQLAADYPRYAIAQIGLAMVHHRDHIMDIERPGGVPALDLALRAAQQAVELAPAAARAHDMLCLVRFTRGEMGLAFEALDRAMALNPYDTNVLANQGTRLVAMGEAARGLAILEEVATHALVRPGWFEYFLFLGAHLQGDRDGAARYAATIMGDSSPWGLLSRALVACAAGRLEEARAAMDGLAALNPRWRTTPRRQLAKFFPTRAVQDRLLADLAPAGVVPE